MTRRLAVLLAIAFSLGTSGLVARPTSLPPWLRLGGTVSVGRLGGGTVPAFLDRETHRLYRAMMWHADPTAAREYMRSAEAIDLPGGTKVRLVGLGWDAASVRIADGPHAGRHAYIPAEWLRDAEARP